MKNIEHLGNICQNTAKKINLLEKSVLNNKIFHNIFFIITLLVVFSVVLFMNIETFLNGDDYVYSFLYQTPHRLSSINDIIVSQQTHYDIWGGRTVAHTIAQLLLFTDNPLLIDVINSLALVALVYIIYLLAKGNENKSVSILFITFALIWLLEPAFAEATLWITGSANYLWGTLIILLFILPYRLYEDTENNTISIVSITCMLLGGIIAGWTNENTAAAMVAMAVCFILYYRHVKYRIPLWMYSGVIGALIGYVLMIIAPGNFARAGSITTTPFVLLYRTLTYTQSFINHLGVLNLGIIILFILYNKSRDHSKKNITPYLIIFLIGLFISIYIMIGSPAFPGRAWFGSIVFNIIILGLVLFNLDYKQVFFRQIKRSILIFCIIAFGFSFYDAYRDVTAINQIWAERMKVIEDSKRNNVKAVSFKQYSPKTKFGLGDTPYALKYMSDYYEIDFQLED